jgi:hypothetical protein
MNSPECSSRDSRGVQGWPDAFLGAKLYEVLFNKGTCAMTL